MFKMTARLAQARVLIAGVIKRLLDPKQVLRSWDRPDYGFPEVNEPPGKPARP